LNDVGRKPADLGEGPPKHHGAISSSEVKKVKKRFMTRDKALLIRHLRVL
jgi:hypothetical protein